MFVSMRRRVLSPAFPFIRTRVTGTSHSDQFHTIKGNTHCGVCWLGLPVSKYYSCNKSHLVCEPMPWYCCVRRPACAHFLHRLACLSQSAGSMSTAKRCDGWWHHYWVEERLLSVFEFSSRCKGELAHHRSHRCFCTVALTQGSHPEKETALQSPLTYTPVHSGLHLQATCP